MNGRRWTIEELIELVRGGVIVARDLQAQTVRLPSALTEVAEPDARAWEAQLSQEHPADLGVVIDAWWRAVATPGEPQVVEARRQLPDGWFRHDVTCLNLTHQDDFGFMLTMARPKGEPLGPEDLADEPGVDGGFTAPATIVQHLDELGVVLRTEGDVDAIFGVAPHELEGEAVLDRIHVDDHSAAVTMWLEVLSSPEATRTIQQRVQRPDGSVCWIQSTVMNRLGTSSTVLSVSHDIGAQRAQQEALVASEEDLVFLTEAVPVGVFRGTPAGVLTFSNGRFESLVGSADTLDGLLESIDESARDELRDAWSEVAAKESNLVTIVRAVDGRHLEFRLHGGRDARRGDTVGSVIGTVDDVTVEVMHTEQLEATARLDPLTGLSNRRGVEAALGSSTIERRQLVVFGDLDGFKSVNDEFGHDVGDAVLRVIGERLRDAVRPGDLVSRWGGDEFVVVCNDVSPNGEPAVLNRLEAAFADSVVIDGRTHEISVSLGAVWAEPHEEAASVLQRADQAMYESKRRRRGVS